MEQSNDSATQYPESWQRLLQGNLRFANETAQYPHQDNVSRETLNAGQHPTTVMLSCADSRVPPTLIFDQGLGDIFSIRTAGEVVTQSDIESVEYAIDDLGATLLVVLGHEHCGAIKAGIETFGADVHTVPFPTILESVHTSIAIASAKHCAVSATPENQGAQDSCENSDNGKQEDVGEINPTEINPTTIERAHAYRIATLLLQRSEIIRNAHNNGKCAIVVARYTMSDGLIETLGIL